MHIAGMMINVEYLPQKTGQIEAQEEAIFVPNF